MSRRRKVIYLTLVGGCIVYWEGLIWLHRARSENELIICFDLLFI